MPDAETQSPPLASGYLRDAHLFYVAVFLASCVMLLIYSAGWLSPWSTLQGLVKEIGFAGLVSIILIYTIERYTRERHQKMAEELMDRINTDIFRAVYKRRVPESVFREFERLLLNANVCRSDLELTYTLRERQPEDGIAAADAEQFVSCLIQSSYELHNMTDHEITHPVYVFIDAPIEQRFATLCGLRDVTIDGKPLAADVIRQHSDAREGGDRFNYKLHLAPKARVRVSTTVAQVKSAHNTEVWVCSYPSDGLKLTVNTPGRDFGVWARAAHSQRLERDLDNEVTRRWRLRHGILPSQCLYFWWKRGAASVVQQRRGTDERGGLRIVGAADAA